MNSVSTHGSAYTSDPDYLTFLGAPREAIIYDWSIRAYRKVKLSQPKCPHDAVQPVDGDAAIRDERTDLDGNPRHGDAPAGPTMQAKTRALFDEIRDQLQTRPMRCEELAEALGVTYHRIKSLLRTYRHEVVVLHSDALGNLYGLPEHSYASGQVPRYSVTMQRVVDYLTAHGPATVKEIGAATGVWRQSFQALIKEYPDALRIAKTIKPARGGAAYHVWEVAA